MLRKQSRIPVVVFSVVFLTTCASLPSVTEALPQDSQIQGDKSVADAARLNRETKKNLARQSRVISNEDLDLEYFKPGQEGLNLGASASETPSASSEPAAAVGDQVPASTENESRPGGKGSDEEAAEDAEIAKLKKQIVDAEQDLDLQQRELALDQDTVYSNPNYTDSKTGKGKLDAEQKRILERQVEIERLKSHLAALQDLQKSRKQALSRKSAPPSR
jgi:hypothetical protein